MDSVLSPTKKVKLGGLERWIRYLAVLLIVVSLLFKNYSSLLSNGMIASYYLMAGALFIILAVLLILLPKDSKFPREIGILACLAMIIKVVYQATLFL